MKSSPIERSANWTCERSKKRGSRSRLSDPLIRSDAGRASAEAGAHSLNEILSQAKCWETCLTDLARNPAVKEIEASFGQSDGWLFIGCGSSYYVALAGAATMKLLTGRRASAVPASEILLYPDLVFSASRCVPVLISRSGQTSEVLKVAEILRDRGVPSIAISCARGQLLEKLVSVTLSLPADEQSTVMTRSFTSMLLALQFLAAGIAGSEDYRTSLLAMPELAVPILARSPQQIREFVTHHTFADYVCLGQGPYHGLACEYGLKIMEMSLSFSQVFHSLEFRHGPKSVVGPETLLIFLLSERGYEAECDLLDEMKLLGATTMVIANQANARVRAAADLLIELQLPLPELARMVPSLVPGQLLALFTGLKKGLNPDMPRYLSRAVILDDTDPVQASRKPEPVA
ncbi:MAG: SIS domain-containing protein [Terriglobales bacterium]